MCKVSVIMPSLNVAKYIDECVSSVICQTMQDIEIICVDAGSSDGTLEILEAYAQKDSRIKLIKSEKKSYGYQMNLGVKAAKGKYIGVVETDDYIDVDMFERLYSHITASDADFIKSDHYIFTGEPGNYVEEYVPLLKDDMLYGIVTRDDQKTLFLAGMHTWTGLFRRDFLIDNNIWHNETPGAAYQDNGFWFQTVMYAKKVQFVNEAYYHLRRDNPASSFFAKDKLDAIRKEYDFIRNNIVNSELDNKQQLLERCYYYRLVNYTGQERRISDDDFPVYYELLIEDTNQAAANGEINPVLFQKDQTIYLMCVLMHSPPIRYEKGEEYKAWSDYSWNSLMIQNRAYLQLFGLDNRIKKCEKIYIYGAGKIGRRVYHSLGMMGCDEKIEAFIVSHAEDIHKLFGVPIIEIDDFENKETDLVIVAVGNQSREEIENLLKTKGISKYMCFSPLI